MKKLIVLLVMVAILLGAAHAEMVRYTVAKVNVKSRDGYLNVRLTPEENGILTGRLYYWSDVVILEEENGWGLVNTITRMEAGRPPIGWSSMEYLLPYWEYMQKNEPCAATQGIKEQ